MEGKASHSCAQLGLSLTTHEGRGQSREGLKLKVVTGENRSVLMEYRSKKTASGGPWRHSGWWFLILGDLRFSEEQRKALDSPPENAYPPEFDTTSRGSWTPWNSPTNPRLIRILKIFLKYNSNYHVLSLSNSLHILTYRMLKRTLRDRQLSSPFNPIPRFKII